MALDLIIFDCDGVLIDSEFIACSIDAAVLSDFGFEMTTEEVIKRFAGVSEKDMRAAIECETGRPIPNDFEERVAKLVEKAMVEELKAIPNVREVVTQLPVRFCVASSSTPEKLSHSLRLTNLYDLFAPHIFSSTEVANGKPEPDLFLYAAKQMGVKPACCLVVEDSTAGVQAARAAGMYPVGFVGGSHCYPGHADRLREAGAETIIDRLEGLTNLAGLDDPHVVDSKKQQRL